MELIARFAEYREAMEQRLEKLNELREQVEIDRRVYVRIDVYDERYRNVDERMDKMERRWAMAAGVAAVLIVIATALGAMADKLWK